MRKYLTELGLYPDKESEMEKFLNMEPYGLRKKALYSKLSKYELGRVFYHLCQRRGFKSNRIADVDDKEKSKVASSISELQKEIDSSKSKTLGEFLSSLDAHTDRIRGRYTSREMYENEFGQIWAKQKEFYPVLLSEEAEKAIKDGIYYQRPLASQKSIVGRCKFEKNKKRCPASDPAAQEFRMLQEINNLKISGGDRLQEEKQVLTKAERDVLVEHLNSHENLELKKTPGLLKLPKNQEYKTNFDEKKKIKGMMTIVGIKKALKKEFDRLTQENVREIWHTLYFSQSNDWLVAHLMKKWNFSEECAKNLSKIKLEKEYSNLSYKAINNMLPYLREGEKYHEAARKAGYHHSQVDEDIVMTDYLPEPKNLRNPIVMASLYQLRKVVNALIDRHGKPDIVKIELARDLKKPKQERIAITKKNNEMNARHNEIEDILKNEQGIAQVSREDIVKYKLWEECNRICPYTGKSISKSQLYSEDVEIEHILPYSRTLDNSYMNLSLCFKAENARKGNRSPYELYSNEPERYAAVLERVKDFPSPKARRFAQKEIKTDDFINRQLNDTRYIAREALSYVKHICSEVIVSQGQLTSTLRALWDLNCILPKLTEDEEQYESQEAVKNRGDHRHHAIDAIVTAAMTRAFLKRISTEHGKNVRDIKLLRSKFPAPWDGFKEDVKEAISNIIISHKVNRNLRGSLHDETLYGQIRDIDGETLVGENKKPFYRVRKPLESLTANEVKNIIDPVVKQTVIERLEKFGFNENDNKPVVDKKAFVEPLYLKGSKTGKETIIKSVRIKITSSSMKKLRDYNVWAEPGSNHHIEIFANEDGELSFRTVSLFDAVKSKDKKESVIDKKGGKGGDFLLSLMKNELIMVGGMPEGLDLDDKSMYNKILKKIYRVQKMDVLGNVVLRLHYVTATDQKVKRGVLRKNYNTLIAANPVKVDIDPIGYLKISED